MITDNGKYHIKRYLAGQVPLIARGISFGIGSAAVTAADKSLQFEIGRAPISNISYNYDTNKVIFKAIIPQGVLGKITEIGLWSEMTNAAAGQSSDRMITTFDDLVEDWSDTPTWVAATSSNGVRIGDAALRQAPGAGATITNSLSIDADLSPYSAADKFVFAYNNLNTNVSSITFRFKTDASNYYAATFTDPSAGYHFDTLVKSGFTATGSPNWSAISSVEVITVSKPALASQVDFDGIQIIDVDTVNPNYVLVGRQLETSFNIVSGVNNEIEYPLGVTIT